MRPIMSEVFILGWYPGFGVMEFRFWNVGSLPSGKASWIPTELLLMPGKGGIWLCGVDAGVGGFRSPPSAMELLVDWGVCGPCIDPDPAVDRDVGWAGKSLTLTEIHKCRGVSFERILIRLKLGFFKVWIALLSRGYVRPDNKEGNFEFSFLFPFFFFFFS